jgi:eukaryotic-like serine/threonine-protein kinase
MIHDVSRGGPILLSQIRPRMVALGLPPGETQERGFSWHDYSRVTDLSSDGRTLVFMEIGEAGGRTGVVYMRPTDGAPAVRLGEGQGGPVA